MQSISKTLLFIVMLNQLHSTSMLIKMYWQIFVHPIQEQFDMFRNTLKRVAEEKTRVCMAKQLKLAQTEENG